MWKTVVLVAVLVMASSTQAWAEKFDYGVMILDMEDYHRLIVDRCRRSVPESVTTLQTAMN